MKLVLISGGRHVCVAEPWRWAARGLGNAEMMDVICQSAVARRCCNTSATRSEAASTTHVRGQTDMKDLDINRGVPRQDHCPMPLVAQVRQRYEAAFVNGCGVLIFVLARKPRRIASLYPGFDDPATRRRHQVLRRTCRRKQGGSADMGSQKIAIVGTGANGASIGARGLISSQAHRVS